MKVRVVECLRLAVVVTTSAVEVGTPARRRCGT